VLIDFILATSLNLLITYTTLTLHLNIHLAKQGKAQASPVPPNHSTKQKQSHCQVFFTSKCKM
jgi:hypothetical protein